VEIAQPVVFFKILRYQILPVDFRARTFEIKDQNISIMKDDALGAVIKHAPPQYCVTHSFRISALENNL
jgi:hypothetical protein